MIWKILGIEPTKDTEVIKKAYRSKLVNVNPEDKPEEFKALRSAYEDAITLAEIKEEEEEKAEETPVDIWMNKVADLYFDFKRRISPDAWREVLADEICTSLDTKAEAEEALLVFFMKNYYLPQKIWILLDQEFNFMENLEDLYEIFPRDFIDFVISEGVRFEENLPYSLFTPGENAEEVDEYIRAYNRVVRCPIEERAAIYAEMEALSESHPYGELRKIMDSPENANNERIDELVKFAEAFPEDVFIKIEVADQLMQCQRYEESIEFCKFVLEKYPDRNRAKWLLAHNYAGMENYKEATEMIADLMQAAAGDQKLLFQLSEARVAWNEALINSYRERIEKDENDSEAKEELVWCLLQNDKCEEARAIAETIKEGEISDYQYHNVLGQTFYNTEDRLEDALVHIEKLLDILKDMKPDGTEETDKRIEGFPDKRLLHAKTLHKLDRLKDAELAYEKLAFDYPENAKILTHCVFFYMNQKKFGKASQTAEQLIEVSPDTYYGYLLLANAYFEMEFDREAFEAINRAIELDGSDFFAYIIKIRILIRNEAFDAARDIIGFLESNGIENNITLEACKALIVEFETKDVDKAIEAYDAVIERIENGEEMDFSAAIFYRYAILTSKKMGNLDEEKIEQLIAILDRGLKFDKVDIDCLDYKAWLVTKQKNKTEEAIELYHTLENYLENNRNIERQLADLYYRNVSKNADKALHYYKLLLARDKEDPVILFYVGMCLNYMGEYEEAESIFLKEKEVEPDETDAPYRLSMVYESMGRYEEALANAEEAIAIVADKEGNNSSYYLRKVQILRRLGRFDEAVSVIRFIEEKYNFQGADNKIFTIYAQAGMYDKAEALIEDWQKKDNQYGAAMAALVELKLMEQKTDEARKLFAILKDSFSNYQKMRVGGFMAVCNADSKTELELRLMDLESCEKEDYDDISHANMEVALAYWRMGDWEKAKEYAKASIEAIDIMVSRHITNKTLFYGRKALLLALVESKEAALAEIERVRTLPLCSNCPYDGCKDVDIFEIYVESMYGDDEKSLELCKKGIVRWPDEGDFVCHMEYLKSR